jgi:hypothetical protein
MYPKTKLGANIEYAKYKMLGKLAPAIEEIISEQQIVQRTLKFYFHKHKFNTKIVVTPSKFDFH